MDVFPIKTSPKYAKVNSDKCQLRDRLQISLLILNEFKGINLLLFPLKLSENRRFADEFSVIEVN